MLDEMRSYHQGYTTEALWTQSYRILCLMVETLLFASAFGLIQFYKEGQVNLYWMGLLLALGLFFIFVWMVVCESRNKRATAWLEMIRNLKPSPSTPEAQFQEQCKRTLEISLGRWAFNWVMPLLLLVAWVLVFWMAVCS